MHCIQSEITDSGSGVEFCGDATVRQNMLATVAAYFTDPTGSKPCPEQRGEVIRPVLVFLRTVGLQSTMIDGSLYWVCIPCRK